MVDIETSGNIRGFVMRMRRRLNRRGALASVCIGALVAGVGAAGVAIGFVLAGYRVRVEWFAIPLIAGLLVTVGRYVLGRWSEKRAAEYADRFFDLTDGLTSAVGFQRQGKTGGIYGLQAAHTARGIDKADPTRIRVRPPWAVPAVIFALLATIAYLSTFRDSPPVLARRIDQAQAMEQTAEINELLEEVLRRIEEELDDEQKELLAKSEIRRMVDELKPTKDRKEAMGQYARIEKRIREATHSAQTERDEKFLAAASEELNKSKDTRRLGKTLEEKKYKQAGKDFEKMKLKPSADRSSECRADLNEAREKLDRLRSASRRMKSAAERMSASKSRFKRLSENLYRDGQATESALCKAEKEMGDSGSCSMKALGELGERAKKSNASAGEIARALRGLDAKRGFFKKMDALRDCLGRSQGALAGACAIPQLAEMNQRGIGSQSDGRFTDRDTTEDPRGIETQLTGAKGEGPALVAVEDAASGDGVSTISSRRSEVKFRKQMESLVRREDVPENLKDGVRNYFESIHETPGESE